MRDIIPIVKSIILSALFGILFVFTSCERDNTVSEVDSSLKYPTSPLASINVAFPNHEKELIELPSGIHVEKVLGLEKPKFIFQGDIVLEEEDLAIFDGIATRGSVNYDEKHLWTDNEVYYCVASDFQFADELNEAIEHWESKTNLRFITTERIFPPWVPPFIDPTNKRHSYIFFFNSSGEGTYSSHVGRRLGEQLIAIDDWASTGEIIHEIGHAIGLLHEQSRLDRDDYINIHWENIEDVPNSRAQFEKWSIEFDNGVDIGSFDFNSIMLYHSFAFSKYVADYENNPALYWENPVMTKKNGETFSPQRDSLTVQDIISVNYLYPGFKEPSETEPTILTFSFSDDMDVNQKTLKFNEYIQSSDTVFVNLGNGDYYIGLSSGLPTITYPNGTFIVKVWANDLDLQAKGGKTRLGSALQLFYLPLVKVHLSQDTRFTGLNFSYSNLSELTYNNPPNFNAILSFYETFYNTQLNNIANGLFSTAVNAADFRRTFAYTNIEEIPEGLFRNCPLGSSFEQVFSKSPIRNIPEDIFSMQVDAHSFNGAFSHTLVTEIPPNIFKNNLKVYTFDSVFSYCPITSIPNGLFDNNRDVYYFSAAFAGTQISDIPQELFYNNTKVGYFSSVFSHCYNLTAIPENLFSKNTEADSFSKAFESCERITEISPNLFSKNTKTISFSNIFSGCKNLRKIPSGLFRNNLLAGNCTSAFSGTAIDSIPENLFQNRANSSVLLSGAFGGCQNLSYIPAGLFSNVGLSSIQALFRGCISLTEIPEGLFDNAGGITNMESIFNGCINLRVVPQNLFDEVSPNAWFLWTFEDCRSLQTAIPLWESHPTSINTSGCYRGCNNVSNWNDIPDSWK